MKVEDVRAGLGEVLRLLGLDVWKCHLVEAKGPFGREKLVVDLSYELSVPSIEMARGDVYAMKAMADALAPIRESIMKSPEVTGYVEALEKRAREAEALGKELRPYKIHFEVEMQLRHGRGT